jgi:uncharacterized membrane protein HdeD (DUF308 family)
MKPASNKLAQWNRLLLGFIALTGYLVMALLEVYKSNTFTLAQTWPVIAYAVIRAVFNIDAREVERKNGDTEPPGIA